MARIEDRLTTFLLPMIGGLPGEYFEFNLMAKLAHGIADDMLTTTVMACRCKKILAPASIFRSSQSLTTSTGIFDRLIRFRVTLPMTEGRPA